MSKSTKVIAALGVAAGLGVAALPAATFAATGITSRDVTLSFQVDDELALSITSGDSIAYGMQAAGFFANGSDEDSTYNTATSVVANATQGYTMSVAAKSATATDKTSAEFTDTAGGAGTLAPWATNAAIETIGSTTAAGWGIKIDSLPTGFSAGTYNANNYNGVANTATQSGEEGSYVYTPTANTVMSIDSLSGKTTTAAKIDYGIKLSDTQPSGTYQAQITYSVANN